MCVYGHIAADKVCKGLLSESKGKRKAEVVGMFKLTLDASAMFADVWSRRPSRRACAEPARRNPKDLLGSAAKLKHPPRASLTTSP